MMTSLKELAIDSTEATILTPAVCAVPVQTPNFYCVRSLSEAYSDGVSKQDTGTLNNVLSTNSSAKVTAVHRNGGRSCAETFCNAAIGMLGAYAKTVTNDTYYSELVAIAFSSAYFHDTIAVRSHNLAIGSPVTLIFSQVVAGAFEMGEGESQGTVQSTFRIDNELLYYASNIDSQSDTTQTSDSQILVVNTTVGSTINICGRLDAIVQVHNGGSIVADYSNTTTFYADSQTPEVILVSASGHDYSHIMPECDRLSRSWRA
ncbi:hypothetical protein ACE1CD_12700 [Aerosakkonema sp. BLCC-F183]|uniref:hypothetical protein n=1 Tax=Aerosakkonema sp. BLCC-F183 TaxID=3342834 RepID=UPI0035B74385